LTSFDPSPQIARALQLRAPAVSAVLAMLSDGNTVPFIARYRKEATGGLDEVAIGAIDVAVQAARALEARREAILKALEEQGVCHGELERRVRAATDRPTLEDLYLPHKKKRKTRASMARARGLEPLAKQILNQRRDGHPQREAQRFLGPEVPDAAAALAGARDIVAETLAEAAPIRAMVRALTTQHGRISSRAIKKATEGKRTAFEDYYDFAELSSRIPSHRYLALCRGESEGVLRLGVDINAERMVGQIERDVPVRRDSPWAKELREAVADGYKRLLAPSVANEVRAGVRERAEAEAVQVFATNLQNLLLAAPFGRRRVIGIDPGFRSGCKCAALSSTGRFLGHTTLYPHTTREGADHGLVAFVRKHGADAIAVGNGTAGRETLDFARKALAAADIEAVVVSVNESGASIYSASAVAREEFPELDLTVRGAISIGRRLQDPLAELVKVDPQSLGVGQYQHDVTQRLLEERLARVVELCVNRIGVQLDTASAALLRHVAGVGPVMAKRIVEHRDAHGVFASRRELLKVKGLGPKAFEQAAGFLRIRGAANPLDDSAVHPERYGLVRQMAKDLGVPVPDLVGDAALARRIDAGRYPDVGALTLADIVQELGKPGLDPRETFEPPRFRDDVQKVEDLEVGMVLEGVVTNVAAFGAFVDIGVHQDGLVHVSKLAKQFVRDPHAVVAVGQRLQVRVMQVDLERGRISLSVRDV
jgi:protein Tex